MGVAGNLVGKRDHGHRREDQGDRSRNG